MSNGPLCFTCYILVYGKLRIQFYSDKFTIVTIFSLLIFFLSGSNGMLFGSGDIQVLQDKDYDCKVFRFDPEFSSDDVYVQLAVTSMKYEAAVSWIGSASRSG